MPVEEELRRPPRERLLEAARELFYTEGVHTVGIDRVIERAGVAKASLYSTFGSKDGLVKAYLEEYHDRMISRRRAAAEAESDPVAAILAVFDSLARDYQRPITTAAPSRELEPRSRRAGLSTPRLARFVPRCAKCSVNYA